MNNQEWQRITYRLRKVIDGVEVDVPHEEWIDIPGGKKMRTLRDDEHGTLCEMQLEDGSITQGYIATRSNVDALNANTKEVMN